MTWNGSITATASGIFSPAAVLNPVNPSIAITSTPSRHALSRPSSRAVNTCLERPSTMSSSLDGPVPSRTGVKSMITADVLVALAGVPPAVLVHADDLDLVEPVRIVDQHPAALGDDGVVGGVPRHAQTLGDPGHGQVLAHDADQRPPQRSTGEPGPGLGGRGGVLPPHVPAPIAPVAADPDQQDRRPPPQRLMCQSA